MCPMPWSSYMGIPPWPPWLPINTCPRRCLVSPLVDTPGERGRVTPDLVKETRAHLDLGGFRDVKIMISGGLDPVRIRYFLESGAPVDGLGVGSYISGARPH